MHADYSGVKMYLLALLVTICCCIALSESHEYVKIGCYKDKSNRAIPTLEGTDSRLDGKYQNRKNAIKKCSNVAHDRGYSVFAVQNGGWCASSKDAYKTYDKYGTHTSCKSDGKGGGWGNEVYVFGKKKHACEHKKLKISCSADQEVKVITANYGRTEEKKCDGKATYSTKCQAKDSLSKVKERCEGKSSCKVKASNDVFGDPCRNTFKYLEVTYQCKDVEKVVQPVEETKHAYYSIGCFRDASAMAIAPLEGLDSRLDGSYKSRADALKKCAKVVEDLEYAVFALQDGGGCASSVNAHETYGRYGASEECMSDGRGGPSANEVYIFEGKEEYVH